MKRPDYLPTLHNMDAPTLGQCIAHASGLLGSEIGEEGAALMLRRIADRLERRSGPGEPGRPVGRWKG